MVKHFDDLSSALREFRMPIENHTAIYQIKNVVGGFTPGIKVRKDLIIAQRLDGKPEIQIGLGSVSGFISEEEAAVAAGGRSKRPSDRGNGLWRVDLPVLSRG